MKQSEKLVEQYNEADNDLAALGIGKKIIREERIENFEEKWLKKFQLKFGDNINWVPTMFCYRINDNGKIIDFYPKANKLFIKKNKPEWIKPGLKYLVKMYFTVDEINAAI